jgi:predicted dehydrogenase
MLKIGVLGAGHLGRIHLKLLKSIEGYELVGFYDPDDTNANKAIDDHGVTRFATAEELIDAVDVVDVVTPTVSHFESAAKAIKRSKHVFIEKPVTATAEEARNLISLADEADVKVMVGHVERFNPAYLAVKDRTVNPMFIEAHRLAQFNPRGTDVSVILDLMIHDIDIILSMVNANVKRISASGVAVLSRNPDIANARIEFDNGCVANITASRISMKQMRKIRLFQPNNYLSIDLLEKKTEIFSLSDVPPTEDNPALELETGNAGETKYIRYEEPSVGEVNAIKMELELFKEAIENDTEPPVTLTDGYNALDVALQVMKKIEKNSLGIVQ